MLDAGKRVREISPDLIKGFVAILAVAILSLPLTAVDHKWHADATRLAMKSYGFSDDARLLAQFTNFLIDLHAVIDEYGPMLDEKIGSFLWMTMLEGGHYRLSPEDMARLHFDSLKNTRQVEWQWKKFEENVVNALKIYSASQIVKPGFRPIVLLTIVGASLHVIQDFYTHSNWVEQCLNDPEFKGKGVPTWFEVSAEKRSRLELYSGVYPDGSEPGAPDHKNLNKDNSQRPFHKEAVEVMKRGSLEWLERLLKINEVPWDSLRSYEVKSIPTKRWLRKTDSALITGISSVVKHWDGPKPESRVFDTDPTKDRVKATGILLFVIEDYGLSFAMKDNPYRLPTPNYAGYYVYHIEHELARDLLPLRTFKKTPTIPAFKKD